MPPFLKKCLYFIFFIAVIVAIFLALFGWLILGEMTKQLALLFSDHVEVSEKVSCNWNLFPPNLIWKHNPTFSFLFLPQDSPLNSIYYGEKFNLRPYLMYVYLVWLDYYSGNFDAKPVVLLTELNNLTPEKRALFVELRYLFDIQETYINAKMRGLILSEHFSKKELCHLHDIYFYSTEKTRETYINFGLIEDLRGQRPVQMLRVPKSITS